MNGGSAVGTGKTTRKGRHLRLLAGTLAAAAFVSLTGCKGLSLFGLFQVENPGPLSISPSAAVLQTDETISLRALGGFGAYTFDGAGLLGSFDPASGLYTPPAPPVPEPQPLVETISVSDELGNERTATLSVYNEGVAPLAVTPASWTGTAGESKVFVVSGGFSPYAAALDGASLPVTLDGKVTVDTASLAAGEHRLEITDAMQTLAVVMITLIPGGDLGIDPVSATVASGGTVVFTALNAQDPVFSVDLPGAGIFAVPTDNPASYQAPTIPIDTGTVETVRLADGARTVTAEVHVYNASSTLAISPAYSELLLSETLELKASGGVPPYTFALAGGRGELHHTPGETTAVYTAPADLPTRAQVTLLDSVGSLPVNAVVKVSKPK